ncbi:MAG: VIT domain-containing protein [Gemmataceae bacterium]
MRRLLALVLVVSGVRSADASGLLIPVEKKLPPLALLTHQVNVDIEDQVALTTIEQVFRNHTDRQLEATYVFPIPKGASVRKFVMWVDGKETHGELVEAKKAKEIYQSIVSRTLDPGLLEYMGNNLLKMSVFPIPPKGDQKIKISYTSVAPMEGDLVEYTYPMRTDSKAARTLEKFSLTVKLKSQHPITNVYSPTHAITTRRPSDKEAVIGFEKDAAVLDKDFTLYYSAGGKDVGVTALTHRPNPTQDGYFLMLISPRTELSKARMAPRDMVFVLDTSGSMRGRRMEQAKRALKICLDQLNDRDRFAIMNFATTVNKYRDRLDDAHTDNIIEAKKWVDGLEATGGTAINDALANALAMRNDPSRIFTVVFFTDGRPTIGETDGEKILKNVSKQNTANTRIFTFGVGDDVNATLLDQLAEQTRAVSSYVRESEAIETKAEALFAKIANPVLANLKLQVTGDVTINEVYPPQLPDLFHGNQVVVLGRYHGKGHAAVKLTGQLGKETQEFVYELGFTEKTVEDKAFVEDLWARRKVGYLLDQIRLNGESKEVVEEVVALAKRYGITTPYTSYLVVPDTVVPVAAGGAPKGKGAEKMPDVRLHLMGGDAKETPPALDDAKDKEGKPATVETFLKRTAKQEGDAIRARYELNERELGKIAGEAKKDEGGWAYNLKMARDRFNAYRDAEKELRTGRLDNVQNGKLAVDLSCDAANLRSQSQVSATAQRWLGTRNCLEVGGVWIDEAYEGDMKTVTVKAMSPAYFRILERHPDARKAFSVGNHLVWVTPSRTALIVDMSSGLETMEDTAIEALFRPAPAPVGKRR